MRLLHETRQLQHTKDRFQQQLAMTVQQRVAANAELRWLQQRVGTLERSEANSKVEVDQLCVSCSSSMTNARPAVGITTRIPHTTQSSWTLASCGSSGAVYNTKTARHTPNNFQLLPHVCA